MPKILFIEKRIRADKLGICQLSQVLKSAGHTVDMIQDDVDNAEYYLRINPIDYIMFSVSSGDQDWVFDRIADLKLRFPKIKVVVGGPHFTYFPEQGESNQFIDFVVRGPGDEVILKILNGECKEKVVRGDLISLKNIPVPDRSLIYKYEEFGKSPMKRFMANRHCPNNCSYCFNHHYKDIYKDQKDFFKQLYPIDKIIKEVLEVKENYGLELAYFNDDNLAMNKTWLKEFCKKMKSTGIKFCGSVRADSVEEETFAMMAESGCTFLNMALEAGSENTQKLLRRGNATFSRVKWATQSAIIRHGIKIRIQNMIGLPVENIMEDALFTLKCNQEIAPTDSWCSVYQPYGGTDLAKYCVDKGLVGADYIAQSQYSRSQFKFDDAEKIYRLSKLWWFFVVNKVDMDFVKTLIEVPFTDPQLELLESMRLEKSKKLLYNL